METITRKIVLMIAELQKQHDEKYGAWGKLEMESKEASDLWLSMQRLNHARQALQDLQLGDIED